MRYGQAFKDRAVARLLPPESSAVADIARELGITVKTLERWRTETVTGPARDRVWTAAARLEAVIATALLNDAQRNAWCRAQGLYPAELAKWCERRCGSPKCRRSPAAGMPDRGHYAAHFAALANLLKIYHNWKRN